MSEFKGSPTPWVIDAENYHDYGLIDAKGSEIMIIKAECGQDDHNACLIAAAPDLLKALQNLIAGYENRSSSGMFDMVCHGDEIEKANDAIAKALGETK